MSTDPLVSGVRALQQAEANGWSVATPAESFFLELQYTYVRKMPMRRHLVTLTLRDILAFPKKSSHTESSVDGPYQDPVRKVHPVRRLASLLNWYVKTRLARGRRYQRSVGLIRYLEKFLSYGLSLGTGKVSRSENPLLRTSPTTLSLRFSAENLVQFNLSNSYRGNWGQ